MQVVAAAKFLGGRKTKKKYLEKTPLLMSSKDNDLSKDDHIELVEEGVQTSSDLTS